MLDLKRRGPDLRRFVATLEEWIIRTLAVFDVTGERREDRIGVWVRRPDKGDGARTRSPRSASGSSAGSPCTASRSTSSCDLSHYRRHRAVRRPRRRAMASPASRDLGVPVSMAEVDAVLRREFEPLFGHTRSGAGNAASLSPSAAPRTARPSGAGARSVPASLALSMPSTRAPGGPRRHAAIIASTASAGPANTASTEPSRRLRTQPSMPWSSAVYSVQAR